MDTSSFMFKHWVLNHKEVLTPSKFEFKVVKIYKDPLSRMIGEAIRIDKFATMNSKSDFRGIKLNRLSIEQSDKDTRKKLDDEDMLTEWEEGEMLSVNDIILKSKPSVCRASKRKVDMAEKALPVLPVESEPSPIPKRRRNTAPSLTTAKSSSAPAKDVTAVENASVGPAQPKGIRSGRGVWNAGRRSFSRKEVCQERQWYFALVERCH